MIDIVKGYVNNKEEWRVYLKGECVDQFEDYSDALEYKFALHQMLMEKASVSDDEQPHYIDNKGHIHFKHEKKKK